MDFGFSQEQELLRSTARKFLENECTSGFVRARMEEPDGVTDEFWAKLAEQGWLGLIYPEEHGGSGLGFVDLTVLMEEMGRVVMVARTSEGKAEDGVSLILVPKGTRGLQVKLLPTMDQTRKLCEVSFQDAAVPADALMGVKGKAWPTLTRVVERATVALCAEM